MQAANLTKFRVRVNFIMSLLVKLGDIWQLLKQAYRVETLSLADISFLSSKPGRIVHRLWPPAPLLTKVKSGAGLVTRSCHSVCLSHRSGDGAGLHILVAR